MKKLNVSKKLYVTCGIGLCVLLSVIIVTFVVLPARHIANNLPQSLAMENKKHNVQYADIQNISPYIQEAAVASQDRRFYSNWGVDPIATIRAIIATISTRERQGASTITEQLIKNVYFQDKDTFATDLKTKTVAPFVTARYSKKSILEMYLNGIYFGKNAYGIYQASEIYFHVTPDKVSLAQAAYLMSLINAPSYLANQPVQTATEAKLILSEMVRDNYISAAREKDAENSLQALAQ